MFLEFSLCLFPAISITCVSFHAMYVQIGQFAPVLQACFHNIM